VDSPAKIQVLEVSTDITATTVDEGFVSDDKLIHFALHAVGQIVTVTLADSRGEICRSVIEGQSQSSLSSDRIEKKIKKHFSSSKVSHSPHYHQTESKKKLKNTFRHRRSVSPHYHHRTELKKKKKLNIFKFFLQNLNKNCC
jgi:hypothetical protein